MPHNSTGEKLSFLLYGIDCRTPTEAALLPPHTIEPTKVSDYLEELVLSLSSARQIATEAIRTAQLKYTSSYDRRSCDVNFQMGDWVLVKFPQDETGRLRKLSCPWHGPYRVIDKHDSDITVVKVYAPQDGQIQVHQSRVVRCPPGLPAGFYWYGSRHSSPGRPPKWVDKLLQGTTSTTANGPELVNQSDATSIEDNDHPNPEDPNLNEEPEQTSPAISTPQDNGDALGRDNWDQE